MSEFDNAIAIRTIYGEARGEGHEGMAAVGSVICNRIKDGRWGSSGAAVCLAPFQFSCWNINDPNRRRMIELDETSTAFADAEFAWRQAIMTDTVNGATHYRVIGTPAAWANGHVPVATIGRHEFFASIK